MCNFHKNIFFFFFFFICSNYNTDLKAKHTVSVLWLYSYCILACSLCAVELVTACTARSAIERPLIRLSLK